MNSTSSLLVSGLTMGLAAGLAPGPLSTLVISQTLSVSTRSGLAVAFAPLVSDAFIVTVCVLAVSMADKVDLLMGLVALTGSGYLMLLARETWFTSHMDMSCTGHTPGQTRKAFVKGVTTNMVSPHPYLYWLTVGAPIMLGTNPDKGGPGWQGAAAYLAGFYLSLVGAKIATALMCGRFRTLLSSTAYVWIMRLLAIALAWFALIFIRDGFRLLGLWG